MADPRRILQCDKDNEIGPSHGWKLMLIHYLGKIPQKNKNKNKRIRGKKGKRRKGSNWVSLALSFIRYK